MKKLTMMFLMLMTIVLLVTGALGDAAGAGTEEAALLERLRVMKDFKFRNHEEGIGGGVCPVYSAPSERSFRGAAGKASCNTDKKMAEAGYDANGWLMVRYEIDPGFYRIGYIPPRHVQAFHSTMPGPVHERIPATAAGNLEVTDNPAGTSQPFAVLEEGTPFTILSKYTYSGSWWYIECSVEGKTARGFIDRNKSGFRLGNGDTVYNMQNIGIPSVSPHGTAPTGMTVWPHEGSRKLVREKASAASKQVTVAYPGQAYPVYETAKGPGNTDWYYIFVESDSAWGWIASTSATLKTE